MYWFAKPPYLRWALAFVFVVGGLWLEFRPSTGVSHPFATEAIEPGTPIAAAAVVWIDVPRGIFEPIEGEFVNSHVVPGEPILASQTGTAPTAPSGWWVLEAPMPAGALVGDGIRLVLLGYDEDSPTRAVDGFVVQPPPPSDGFLSYEQTTGLVAVSESDSIAVAEAVASGRITVMLAATR